MSTVSDPHSVRLQQLQTIASSIERVVASFYGPQCSQILMTSSTGKAVVTSDGYTILQSVNATHPVASMIGKAIDSCHRYTHDGCKTFIIYLARFLSLSEFEIQKGKFLPEGSSIKSDSRSNEQQTVLCLSRCLRKILDEVLPDVHRKTFRFCTDKHVESKRSLGQTLKCVVKTTLMPHFNPKLCKFLTELVGDIVCNLDDTDNARCCLDFLLENFSCLCIRSADQPYDRSQTIPSYIIQREFTLVCDSFTVDKAVKVLLVESTLDGSRSGQEPKEILKISTNCQISDSLISRVKIVTNFADRCVKLGVNVIITSEGLPQFALDIMRSRAISVVHYVLKEDMTVLEKLSGALPVSDISSVDEKSIIRAKRMCPTLICGRKCVQIQIDSKIKVKNLILCAPTVGMCDLLYLVVQKAVKAMTLCLKTEELPYSYASDDKLVAVTEGWDHTPGKGCQLSTQSSRNCLFERCHSETEENVCDEINSFNVIAVVPGGGGFEILVSNMLRSYAAEQRNTNLSSVCHIISGTLMCIPHLLYKNTAECFKDKHAYLSAEQYLEDKFREGSLWGLNRRGKPTDMTQDGTLEPLMLKIHTLNCVLELLEQLLRIDLIVGVKNKRSD